MKRSILFGFAAILGTLLIANAHARLTLHYFTFPLHGVLLVGTSCTLVGWWGLGTEYFEAKDFPGKIKMAFLICSLGVVLTFVETLVVYMQASGMVPTF